MSPKIYKVAGVALFLAFGGACSDDDDPAASATSSSASAVVDDLTVRVVAENPGLGCTGTAPIGNGSQLVVLDAVGDRLGVGTFDLTPGADVCDWTATVEDLPANTGLVVLEGDRDELITVDLSTHGWLVELAATLRGVQLVEP